MICRVLIINYSIHLHANKPYDKTVIKHKVFQLSVLSPHLPCPDNLVSCQTHTRDRCFGAYIHQFPDSILMNIVYLQMLRCRQAIEPESTDHEIPLPSSLTVLHVESQY